MEARQLLSKILEITEDSPDGWKYLQFFRSQPKERFAVVCPSPDSLMESWNVLFHDLRILHQLDLYPVLVVEPSTLGYIKTFIRASIELDGEHPFPIQFIRRVANPKSKIIETIHVEKKIPVIILEQKISREAFLTESVLNLINDLQTNKLILLNQTAGIRDLQSNRLSIINLNKEFEELRLRDDIDKEDQSLIASIFFILQNNSNRRLNVSVTSPSSLLKELFTIKGSGTLLKRGSRIHIFDEPDILDKEKLRSLIENSFQKKCKSGFLDQKFSKIILESDYKACALFLETPVGILLSKFAVDEIARGEGVGREIWDIMRTEIPTLFWRAKIGNPIGKWYMKEADGMIKKEGWIYFWIGLKEEKILDVVHFLASLDEDWVI